MGSAAPDESAPTQNPVRLHITPLTRDTAPSLLPASLLPDRSVLDRASYHTLPAFPEKPFGYVDVPADTAAKLRKKLNGVMFRGVKVRVEEARPEKSTVKTKKRRTEKHEAGAGAHSDTEKKARKKAKEEKKRNKHGVLEGVELQGRKVQRGWSGKKEDAERELLFKAAIPANRASIEKKDKKGKKKEKKEKKEKIMGQETRVLKEFDHSTKFPTFLKVAGELPKLKAEERVSEYVEGVGWVDGQGKVVEEVKKRKIERLVERPKPAVRVSAVEESSSSESESEDDDQSVDDMQLNKPEKGSPDRRDKKAAAESPSSSENEDSDGESVTGGKTDTVSQSSEDEDSSDDVSITDEPSKVTTALTTQNPSPSASSTDSPDSDADSSASSASSRSQSRSPKRKPTPLNIHPLEALYKPTVSTSAATPTASSPTGSPSAAASGGFAFSFGAGSGSDSDSGGPSSHTPYRDPARYRSAAPTPDTAIGRRFFSPASAAGSVEGDGSASPTTGRFVPTTPKVLSKSSSSSSSAPAPFTPRPAGAGPGAEPLLLWHEESPFLQGLSVWGRAQGPKLKLRPEKRKRDEGDDRGAGAEEEKVREVPVMGTEGPEGWKEAFYEKRGEWNREWKRRRREALKMKRRRERKA